MSVATDLKADPALRDTLLTYFIENYTGDELSDWLRSIGHDARGTVSTET